MKNILVIMLSIIATVLLTGYLLLFRPYMYFGFERIDSEPVAFRAKYLNAVGDPICTRLYIKLSSETYRAVIPRFPDDLQDPHDSDKLQFGETVELIGYRYKSITRNKLTGNESVGELDRVDVVAWEAVGTGKHSTKLVGLKPNDFHGDNYTACLWDEE